MASGSEKQNAVPAQDDAPERLNRDVENGNHVPCDKVVVLLEPAQSGNIESFRKLPENAISSCDFKAEPESTNKFYDRTPLHLAALYGHVEIVRSILDQIKSKLECKEQLRDVKYAQDIVNARDRFGYTPLHLAIRGQPDLEQPEVQPKENCASYSAQCQEPEKRRDEVVIHLTESSWVLPDRFISTSGLNCEPDFTRDLHMAAQKGDTKAVKLLLQQQCRGEHSACVPVNTPATTWKGDSALDIAKRKGHKDLMELLECFEPGFTPLHMAAQTGNISAVKLLLRQPLCRGEYSACVPVNTRATTWKGDSALDIAKRKGHKDLVDLLECFDLNWLQSERDKNANSMNAVLVGAALVVAATFATWMQPPLGIPDPISDPVTAKLAWFFLFVALAFSASVMSLVLGIFALIPSPGASLKSQVWDMRKCLRKAAYLLLAAILCLSTASMLAGMLVLERVSFGHDAGSFVGIVIVTYVIPSVTCVFMFAVLFVFSSMFSLLHRHLRKLAQKISSHGKISASGFSGAFDHP